MFTLVVFTRLGVLTRQRHSYCGTIVFREYSDNPQFRESLEQL